MHEPAALAAWESFYVIIGSSAAALTGLQFVVMALIADSPGQRNPGALAAFGTPTVVHFCTVLLISAITSSPWPTLSGAATALGVVGVFGLAYSAITLRRARAQGGYQPVFEDWLWHTILPPVAYLTLGVAALTLVGRPVPGMFAIAAAALLLLFVGIHNAWDTATYLAMQMGDPRAPEAGAGPSRPVPPSSTPTEAP